MGQAGDQGMDAQAGIEDEDVPDGVQRIRRPEEPTHTGVRGTHGIAHAFQSMVPTLRARDTKVGTHRVAQDRDEETVPAISPKHMLMISAHDRRDKVMEREEIDVTGMPILVLQDSNTVFIDASVAPQGRMRTCDELRCAIPGITGVHFGQLQDRPTGIYTHAERFDNTGVGRQTSAI